MAQLKSGSTVGGDNVLLDVADSVDASNIAANAVTDSELNSAKLNGISTSANNYSPPQAIATSSNVQFNSLGVGTSASATAGEIRATNNITAYYSDDRLKIKTGNIKSALDKVASLNGFNYIENAVANSFGYNSGDTFVGVSAQEVKAVLPEAVKPAPFDISEDGTSKSGKNYMTVQYEKLVPLLVEAIKELSTEVKLLKGA
jgi:hypothetical protein